MNDTFIKILSVLRNFTFFLKQVLIMAFKVSLLLWILYAVIMFVFPYLSDVYDEYRKDQEVCARLDQEELKWLFQNYYPASKVQSVLNGQWIEYTAKRINLRYIKMERETFSIMWCQSIKVILYTAENNEYSYYIFPRAKDTGEATLGEYNNSPAIIYISKLNGLDYLVWIAKAD